MVGFGFGVFFFLVEVFCLFVLGFVFWWFWFGFGFFLIYRRVGNSQGDTQLIWGAAHPGSSPDFELGAGAHLPLSSELETFKHTSWDDSLRQLLIKHQAHNIAAQQTQNLATARLPVTSCIKWSKSNTGIQVTEGTFHLKAEGRGLTLAKDHKVCFKQCSPCWNCCSWVEHCRRKADCGLRRNLGCMSFPPDLRGTLHAWLKCYLESGALFLPA